MWPRSFVPASMSAGERRTRTEETFAGLKVVSEMRTIVYSITLPGGVKVQAICNLQDEWQIVVLENGYDLVMASTVKHPFQPMNVRDVLELLKKTAVEVAQDLHLQMGQFLAEAKR